MLWKSYATPNMIKVQLSGFFSSDGLLTGNNDDGLGEMINNNEHGVGIIGFGKVSDKVHGDGFPDSSW